MLYLLGQAWSTLLPDHCEVKGFPPPCFSITTFYLSTHPQALSKPTMTEVSETVSLCQPSLFSQVLSSRQSLAPQVQLIYYPVVVWFCWRLRILDLASICVITGLRFTRVVHVMCGDQDPIQTPPYPPCHAPGVFPGSIVQAIPWLRKTAMYLHWMGGLLSMGLLSESSLTCHLLWVKTLGCPPAFSPDGFLIIPKSSPKFPKYSDSVCCYWAVHV